MFVTVREFVLNILFPPSCRGCGKDGVWLCDTCLHRCGPPIDRTAPIRHVDRLLCLGSYDTAVLGASVRGLKYGGGRILANALGHALGALARSERITADCIIPVPLHRKRERSRGFNQAHLIAEGVSAVTSIPLRVLVERTRQTVPQVTLSEMQRRTNVTDAFALLKNIAIAPKHGIIVDDVFTTGATISEIARVLRSAGMEYVMALTIAKG